MSLSPPPPQIGIGVIVREVGKVLLGTRTGVNGTVTWGFSGDYLKISEDGFDCARRETLAETDITITTLTLGSDTKDIMRHTDRHYVTLYVIADYTDGVERVRELDNFEERAWGAWDTLPTPPVLPLQYLYATGCNPFAP
jgi:8-oxo-dGTP diphosphatase